jgi:hypothetical protein
MQSIRENDFECFARTGVNTPETMFPDSGSDNFDVALHKVIALRDSKSLEFQAEVFNVFNHAEFFGTGNRQRKYQQEQLRLDRQCRYSQGDAIGCQVRFQKFGVRGCLQRCRRG